MNSFAYYSPRSLRQTFSLFEEIGSGVYLLAGGTDLLVRIKAGRIQPKAVIDVKGIPELNSGIVKSGQEIHVGALTTMAAIHDDALIGKYFPALSEAVVNIGSVQIRNRASIAGNICNASPAADSVPSLLIYGARVSCVSPRGERILALHDFLLGPGKTALARDELLKEVILPIPQNDQAAAFMRLGRRRGVDLATVNLCCQVTKSNIARFAVGAAGPVAFIVEDSSGVLTDREVSADQKKATIVHLMEKAAPISDLRSGKEYRQAMLAVLGQRALTIALDRLQGAQ